MVHYIRFLKPPIFKQNGSETYVKALITVTTDLGDDFFHQEVSLFATVLDQDDRHWYDMLWKPYMRALWIELTLPGTIENSATTTLLVSPRRTTDGDQLSINDMSEILSARCPIVPSHGVHGVDKVQRKLRTDKAKTDIFEEIGESIARHVW